MTDFGSDDTETASGRPWTEADRQRLLIDCNRTFRPYPREATIDQLFALQVASRPQAPAVVQGDETLSYLELDQRARRLAALLPGLAPGTPVAFCLPQGIDMIVAMLAILQAGGAYLPLDPAFPAARLAFMVAECQPAVVITAPALVALLPAQARILLLDGDGARFADWGAAEALPAALGAHPAAMDIATIFYTSGSTGVPKGVCVPHRAIVRLVVDPGYMRFGPESVVAQVNKASFDAAIFEIWGALLNGGRLVLLARATLLSGRRLAQALTAHGITLLLLPSALLQVLSRECPEAFRGLETLVYGGEPCDPRCLRAILEAGGPEFLINGYGPTETTTFALSHRVTLADACAGPIPIGRPIDQSTAYVLDRDLRPVPPGTVGELYLGGDGVALGYWGRPELTRERFLADPFRPGPEARLYRSGDRVRQRPDGIIEFLGRFDLQVKLRGHRIDLEEVETVLRGHPGVLDCALVVRGRDAESRYLEAFVVPAEPGVLADAPLRGFLAGLLPDFMVPSSFRALARLPLTVAGKLDRLALAEAGGRLLVRTQAGRGLPENPLEARLLELCSELLGNQDLDMETDFQAVGGNSLMAMRLVANVEQTLGLRLTIAQVFLAESLRDLATALATL
jgi:amino acid adenylation domain-containing protein